MFKAENCNAIDWEERRAVCEDGVNDRFQCFDVGCLIAKSGGVNGEFNGDKGACDV
jgi:hypothetical protein